MCCIEIIKENIVEISHKTSISSIEVNKATDVFLDAILDMQKRIGEICSMLDNLIISMKDDFMEISDSDFEEIRPFYKKAVKSLIQLYNECKKSNLHQGIKTQLSRLKSYIDDLNEWDNDYVVFRKELPNNTEFSKMSSLISKL